MSDGSSTSDSSSSSDEEKGVYDERKLKRIARKEAKALKVMFLEYSVSFLRLLGTI